MMIKALFVLFSFFAAFAMADLMEGSDLTLQCPTIVDNPCFQVGHPLRDLIYGTTLTVLKAIRLTENPCAEPDDFIRHMRGLGPNSCGWSQSSGQKYMYAHYPCRGNRRLRELQTSCEDHEVGVRTVGIDLSDLIGGITLGIFGRSCLANIKCELSFITDNFEH